MFEKAIADAVRHGRVNCCRKPFNAVLVSIEAIVLIRSFPDGNAEHTGLLPLISIRNHMSKDALQIYGKRALRKFYHENAQKLQDPTTRKNDIYDGTTDQAPVNSKNESSVHVGKDDIHTDKAKMTSTRRKPEDSETIAKNPNHKSNVIGIHEEGGVGSAPQDQEKVNVTMQSQEASRSELGSEAGNNDIELQEAEVEQALETQKFEDTGGNSKERENASEAEEAAQPWTTKDTFHSLAQFFEATALENLKLTISGKRLFPIEIWEHILDYVSDLKTFNSCAEVSRTLRSVCNQRPLVMDDFVFLKPRIEDSIIDNQLKGTIGKPAKTNFRALQLSSGQQMGINICSRKAKNNGTACRIVVGSERNRKSFCIDCPILLQELEIPAPWEQNTQQRERVRAAQSELEHEDKEFFWNTAFKRFPVTAESPTRSLASFWKELFSHIANSSKVPNGKFAYANRALEQIADNGWEMPSNTIQCLATQNFLYKEQFHYLFVRLKRGCRLWDTLWDDIIREDKDYLGSHDRTDALCRIGDKTGQVIGAHDPFAILVVGLEVRLFKWEQGFDDSVEGAVRKLKSPSGTLTD